MHPLMVEELAAQRVKAMLADADRARLARAARRARRVRRAERSKIPGPTARPSAPVAQAEPERVPAGQAAAAVAADGPAPPGRDQLAMADDTHAAP